MEELFLKLKLFYIATNIPLRLYDANDRLIRSYVLTTQLMPSALSFVTYEKKLLDLNDETMYYTDDFNCHYYSFGFSYGGDEYKIIAGPTADGVHDKKQIAAMAADNRLRAADCNALETYLRSLPRHTSKALRSTEPLLRYLLCGSLPDTSIIKSAELFEEKLDEEKAQAVETQRYHHSINKDALMIEAVKSGDRKRLFELLSTPGDGPEGILCRDDPLRSYKNLFIVTVSYTTKAAIDGGVDSESAYTLSDAFIQDVEEIRSYEDVTELFISMFNSFIDLVEKAHRLKYTSPVYTAVDYINKHYYEDISVKELAKSVHLSESQLFKLFKKQTGMSIKQFQIKKRVTEAANLLKYSDYSIADICNMTGFNDQSYMTRQFMKQMNTTPKKYRDSLDNS
jgi:AraC-like DNA-binding protein